MIDQVKSLTQECIDLCVQIKTCLANERLFLIQFQMDQVLQNNISKENLMLHLNEKKRRLKESLLALDEDTRQSTTVMELKTNWEKASQETMLCCRSNQEFIGKSLRHLTVLGDHLKRLFGERSLYSKLGTEVSTHKQGKVVEVSY